MRLQLCGFVLTVCFMAPLLQSQNFNADSELNSGIAAYENGKYDDAIEHLERAVTLNPKSLPAHLYLAQTYDNAYSEECDWECDKNEQRSVRAIEEFNKVLELDPSNTEALKRLAYRYTQKLNFDHAERYFREAIAVESNDTEALYSLAVIQWKLSYQFRQQRRLAIKLNRDKPLINSHACAEVRSQNAARVEHGISLMERVGRIVRSYDAEIYLNLLYRERADIQCGDQTAYDQDVKTATEWVQRACETRRNPDRVLLYCGSVQCEPPPPPPPPGQPGACPD
jgi:tetratricopeptide (TPR) repeat protein